MGDQKVSTAVKGGCQSLIGVLCPLSDYSDLTIQVRLLHSLLIPNVVSSSSVNHLGCRSPLPLRCP
jgi:hypothetical protein